MDNVCNRCLFPIPSKVEMAEEQEYLRWNYELLNDVMSLRTRTARKFDPSKLEPQYMKFFMELSTMIPEAQQHRNATATQFDSSVFFVRRPEEYEGT